MERIIGMMDPMNVVFVWSSSVTNVPTWETATFARSVFARTADLWGSVINVIPVTVKSVNLFVPAKGVALSSAKTVSFDAVNVKRFPVENAILLHIVRNVTIGPALNAI